MCHLSIMNRKGNIQCPLLVNLGFADVLTDPSNRPDSLMKSTWPVHAF